MFTRYSKIPSAAQRAELSAWIRENETGLRRQITGHAYVFDSVLSHGLFTALRWLVAKPYPERAFSNMSDALDWLRDLDPSIDPGAVLAAMRADVGGAIEIE
jgi:hypothetical protein